MTKVMGARVLALTWDNGLLADQSWENIRNGVKATGCDHKIFKFDEEKRKKLLQAFFKTIGTICICPSFFPMAIFPCALEENVPLIINGVSDGERLGVARGNQELAYSFSLSDKESLREMYTKFYKTWDNIFKIVLKKHYPAESQEIRDSLIGPLKKFIQDSSENDFYPQFVPMVHYVSWGTLDNMKDILGKHLNWKSPSIGGSCKIEDVRGYTEYVKGKKATRAQKNATHRTELSHHIRTGFVTREEALKDLDIKCAQRGQRPESLDEFTKFIDISEKDFDYYLEKGMPLSVKLKALFLMKDVQSTMRWIGGIKS